MRFCLYKALLWVALVPAAWAQSPADAPSHGEVAQSLLREALDPVRLAILRQDYPLAIGLLSSMRGQDAFADAVADYFFEAGFDIWMMTDISEAPDEAPVFEFSLLKATVEYGVDDDGFLGLSDRVVRRKSLLELDGTLEDQRDGRLLWRGSPRARLEDWIREEDKTTLAQDTPQWMIERRATTGEPTGKSGWLEKAAVAGLLTGVAILYFSGAN